MQGILVVKNVGGGVAHDVTLVTSWGDAKVKAPTLAPDEKSEARPAIPRKDWDEHKRKANQLIQCRTASGSVMSRESSMMSKYRKFQPEGFGSSPSLPRGRSPGGLSAKFRNLSLAPWPTVRFSTCPGE
jgi:hypothetical protein